MSQPTELNGKVLDLVRDALHAREEKTDEAIDVLRALSLAGYVIVRMDGGIHEGTCPTCGCQPAQPD